MKKSVFERIMEGLEEAVEIVNGRKPAKVYRYIKHADMPAALAAGWLPVADRYAHHDDYSCLCCWPCACPVPSV